MRGERGSTVVTAIVLMAAMLIVGLSTLSLADGQTRLSAAQRARESSLHLNEGVLYAQAFVLARRWPGAGSAAASWYPTSCVSSSATTTQCPDRNTLAVANSSAPARANFTAADFTQDPVQLTWTTMVRDNGGTISQFFRPGDADLPQPGCPRTPCTLDANGDRRLWVHVRTSVRGRQRATVALLQLEVFKERFPSNAITAGSVDVTNNGNHGGRALVNVTGSQIAVRCAPPSATAGSGNACIDYDVATQIQPRTFVQLPASTGPALSPGALERLRDVAEANGTYHEGCPSSLEGEIVFVEGCTNGHYTQLTGATPCPSATTYPDMPRNGECLNHPTKPGILIFHGGPVTLAGNDTYVGLVYHTNPDDRSDAPMIETQGNFMIYGAVAIDGSGRLAIGSNAGPNLRFFPDVFNGLRSFGTAGLVQNTWRELSPAP